MSWLGWEEETTLKRKEALVCKTTFSLCNTRKGSLQDNTETQLTEVIAMRKATLFMKKDREISLIGSKGVVPMDAHSPGKE